MNNLTFQPALVDDAKLLSTLFKTVYMETYGVEGVTAEFSDFMDAQFAAHKIEESIQHEATHLWVAKFNANPVGVVQVEEDKPCPVNNFNAPEINKLYILRHFNGAGIGQRLMSMAEHHLRERGADQAWLWVLHSNQRAIHFYQKQGFSTIGVANFQMAVNSYTNNIMLKRL